MRVRVVLCVGWWLCFSACNLKKDYLVLCLLCLLIGIETDMGTEEETGVRQQKDSRIRQETGRKIKKRRESRGEERSWRFVFLLVAIVLFSSLSSLLSSSLSAQTAHQEGLRPAAGHTAGGMGGRELPA